MQWDIYKCFYVKPLGDWLPLKQEFYKLFPSAAENPS